MSAINDGGPAFPLLLPAIPGEPETYWNGMTLRDWFAGQALAGEFVQSEFTGMFANNSSDAVLMARARVIWRMADAMLAARKGGSND